MNRSMRCMMPVPRKWETALEAPPEGLTAIETAASYVAAPSIGQHSIRVNDRYRVCFVWTEMGPAEVEITDYH